MVIRPADQPFEQLKAAGLESVENIREKKRIDQREYPISNDEVCSRWRSENEAYPGRTAPQEDNGDRGTEVPLNK